MCANARLVYSASGHYYESRVSRNPFDSESETDEEERRDRQLRLSPKYADLLGQLQLALGMINIPTQLRFCNSFGPSIQRKVKYQKALQLGTPGTPNAGKSVVGSESPYLSMAIKLAVILVCTF